MFSVPGASDPAGVVLTPVIRGLAGLRIALAPRAPIEGRPVRAILARMRREPEESPMRMLRLALPVVAAALSAGPCRALADPLPPPDRPIEEAVDHFIDAALEREGVGPASPAEDATLIRRLTLDLAGRIPTAEESRAYLESTDPRKR